MTARRGRGEGSVYWDDQRKRWRGEITIGYDARGKRITRKASGKTKTEAKNKLKEIQRDYEEGPDSGICEGYRRRCDSLLACLWAKRAR